MPVASEVLMDGSGNPLDLRIGNRRGLLTPMSVGTRTVQNHLRRQVDLVQKKRRRISGRQNPQASRQGLLGSA